MSDWTRFWETIELGKTDPDALERRISEMSEEELVDFYWRYLQSAANLKDDEFVEQLSHPRTEDWVDDLTQWIVGQGLDYYESIMEDPSNMPKDLPEGEDPPPWPGLAVREYRKRYGRLIRDRDEPPPAAAS